MKSIANQEFDYGKAVGRCAELLRRLGEAGLTYDDLQRPIDDPNMRQRLVHFWKAGGHVPLVGTEQCLSASQAVAKEIMGEHFIGIREVSRFLGMSLSDSQLLQMETIPFSADFLEKCKHDHLLIAGYPVSIRDLHSIVPRSFFAKQEEAFYWHKNFAVQDKTNLRWYLIPQQVKEGTLDKTEIEQSALLSHGERMPKVCEVSYLAMVYYLARGKKLLSGHFSRCQSIGVDGMYVYVGYFNQHGFNIDFYVCKDYKHYLMGVLPIIG